VLPLQPHEHRHIDVVHINMGGTFFFLCSLLDGFSRSIVHWELRESMKEWEVETIVQRGPEKSPSVMPRIISDNGTLFIARAFKSFVRIQGLTHVRMSPYYPQSNGKLARWHASLKWSVIDQNVQRHSPMRAGKSKATWFTTTMSVCTRRYTTSPRRTS
jgi:putative transposase